MADSKSRLAFQNKASRRSLLHLRKPVQDDGERCRVRSIQLRIDEKLLSVIGHVVGKEIHRGDWLPQVGKEQSRGRAGFKSSASLHVHRHQGAPRRKIEQFLTIAPPARLFTAAARDLPLTVEGGEGRNVDLPVS